jgi:hypothetical protein
MVLRSTYLSMACGERSRPKPDCLKPPKGVATEDRSKLLTHTVPARSAAAEREAGALRDADIDVAEHPLHVPLIDQRAHLSRRIKRVAERDLLGHDVEHARR